MNAAPPPVDLRKGSWARAEHDWYVDAAEHTEALLAVETFAGLTLDPACGRGTIPLTLRRHGIPAIGCDLVDRGFGAGGVDFLTAELPTVANVVVNPPYRLAEAFVDRALAVARSKVALLLPLTFLEGSRRGCRFTTDWPLARVWVFSYRISLPPGALAIKAEGGKKAYAWFVFEHGHVGRARLGWLL